MSFRQDADTGLAECRWAIVVARDGNSPNTLVSTDGGTLYKPEQDVLAFGTLFVDNNLEVVQVSGNTKTMRKMLIGDTLNFIMLGIATKTTGVRGVVQFFCKT